MSHPAAHVLVTMATRITPHPHGPRTSKQLKTSLILELDWFLTFIPFVPGETN